MFQHRVSRVASVASRLNDVPTELGCNTALAFRFSIDHALSHATVHALFKELQTRGTIGAMAFDDWKLLLLKNYQRKYKRELPVENVRFNVKNNLLFRDGSPDFDDTIYHAIEIPYTLAEDGTEPECDFLRPVIETKLEIRVLIVNGMLSLQLGSFDKASSPDVLRNGSLAVYQRY